MSVAVSIIVVAADSGALLRECVARVLAEDASVEVILVDNASRDGAPQLAESEFAGDARLRLLRNRTNIGFGAAVNRGAADARGDALLILNPDCLLGSDTVEELLAVMRAHPDAGVIGAVMCDEQGNPDPASRRRDPLLRRSLNAMTGRAKRERENARFEGVDVPGPIPDDVIEVENVSGALLLLPRAAFERLGGFDEGYFLHCEDLDLCRRARDAGCNVLLAGNVRVLHGKGGSSTHRPVLVSRHKHRGMWRWFVKFDPAARNPLLRALVWCGIQAHFVLQVAVLLIRRLMR